MPEKKYIEENNSVASEPVAEYGVATKRMSVDEYFDILHKMVDEHYDNLHIIPQLSNNPSRTI